MFFLSKTSKRRLLDRLEAVENQVKNLVEDFTDLQDRTTRRYARILKQVERSQPDSRSPSDGAAAPRPLDPISAGLLRRRASLPRLPGDGEGEV